MTVCLPDPVFPKPLRVSIHPLIASPSLIHQPLMRTGFSRRLFSPRASSRSCRERWCGGRGSRTYRMSDCRSSEEIHRSRVERYPYQNQLAMTKPAPVPSVSHNRPQNHPLPYQRSISKCPTYRKQYQGQGPGGGGASISQRSATPFSKFPFHRRAPQIRLGSH